MDNKKRAGLLEQKRLELEVMLRSWAADTGILTVGEQLSFEVRISSVATVRGCVIEETLHAKRKELLPLDEAHSHGDRSIWRLTNDDWSTCVQASFNDQQMRFLALLRLYQNGPLHITEVTANGIEWDKGFVYRFNQALKRVSDYFTNKVSGAYYNLMQVKGKSGYYAIRKYQHYPDPAL